MPSPTTMPCSQAKGGRLQLGMNPELDDVLVAGEAAQGPPAGQALGAVAGGGIGQVHPAVALAAAAAIQIGAGQEDRPAVGAVQAQGQGAGLGVEGGDSAAAAVGHPELGDGVVATDDPIPHRQLPVLDLQPLASEAAPGRPGAPDRPC
jgi:hypothetical protein